MTDRLPAELSAILRAPTPQAQENAWEKFVAVYGRLVLHAARSLGRDYDQAMDRYACALERLHEDDFHRLRAYNADHRAKFSTWLVVVVRRICLDHYRQRYGRNPGDRTKVALNSWQRTLRRQLADNVAEPLEERSLTDHSGPDPATDLDRASRSAHLDGALESLPPEDRLLLRLRFEDDLSAREIAEVVGLPSPFHVYRRLNALLAGLREIFREKGIGWDDL